MVIEYESIVELKAHPNVLFHCPTCGEMNQSGQTVITIDEQHFILNCTYCTLSHMISRLR